MKVGFVGLGNMGLPMAENICSAGYDITGFDLKTNIKSDFPILRDIKDVVHGKQAIFTMLPGGCEVKEVYSQIVSFCSPGAVLVDCSTVDVKSAHSVNKLAKEYNLINLDSPVSGGVVGAEQGTLTFMVGGDQEGFEFIKPLFNIMGKKVVYCGLSGAGQAAKICNNMILGISMIGVCEAFSLADKIGLDREKMFEVSSSSSGQCWSLNTYCPAPGIGPRTPSDDEYKPGFAAELMLKDLLLAQEAAKQANAHTPLGEQASLIYQNLVKNGGLGKDFSFVLPFFEKKKRI